MNRKKIFSFLVFVFCFFIFWQIFSADKVRAQSIGIKISPVKIEELVDPGETLKDSIKIGNESDSPKIFYVYLKDFKAGDESGRPKLIAPGTEKGYFLASWIDISSAAIELAPGQEKQIPFTITVPEDTGPGGYFGGVFFGTEPPRLNIDSEDKGAGIAIAQQNGTLILLRVKGEVVEKADIREFNTDKDVYSTPLNVEFVIRIENKGNVHIKPYGNISISNMFGREVAQIAVNESGGNVLPDSIRRYTSNWEAGNGFGRYKASLGLSYGTAVDMGGQGKFSLYTEKYFWIIPWRTIIPVLLILIILTSTFVLLLRLYKNKAIRKAMEQAGLGHVRYVQKFQGPSPVMHLGMILLVVFVVLFLMVTAIYFLFFA